MLSINGTGTEIRYEISETKFERSPFITRFDVICEAEKHYKWSGKTARYPNQNIPTYPHHEIAGCLCKCQRSFQKFQNLIYPIQYTFLEKKITNNHTGVYL